MTLTPDVKRAIARSLDEGSLDPHDTLSSTEVEALRAAIAPEVWTYRFYLDVNITSHDEPDIEELERQAGALARGLGESDAFPNPMVAVDRDDDADFHVVGSGLCERPA